MAVFETFTLLFKADSTQLKKEVDDVKKKTGESSEVFKNIEEQTKKTDIAFVGLAKSLAGVAAAYFSVGSVVGGFSNAISNISDLALVSKELGLSTEVLDAWGKALKNFGVAPEEFANTVRTLKKLFNTSGQGVVELLPEIGDAIKRLGPIEGPRYAQEELGISAGITAFIGQGSDVFLKELARQKELGLVSAEDVKVAQAFNKSMGELANAFDALYRALAQEILPELVEFIKTLTNLVETLNKFNVNKKENLPWWLGGQNEDEGKKVEASKNTFTNEKVIVPESYNVEQIPPSIAPMTNSQSRTLHIGALNVTSNSTNPKEVADETVLSLSEQLKQSNANFDDSVVV